MLATRPKKEATAHHQQIPYHPVAIEANVEHNSQRFRGFGSGGGARGASEWSAGHTRHPMQVVQCYGSLLAIARQRWGCAKLVARCCRQQLRFGELGDEERSCVSVADALPREAAAVVAVEPEGRDPVAFAALVPDPHPGGGGKARRARRLLGQLALGNGARPHHAKRSCRRPSARAQAPVHGRAEMAPKERGIVCRAEGT